MTLLNFRNHLVKERATLLTLARNANEDAAEAYFEGLSEFDHVLKAIDKGLNVKDACEYVGVPYLVTSETIDHE